MAHRRESQPLNIIVQGRNLDLTPALRDHVERKLGKLTRQFDQIQEAQVVLSAERNRQGRAQVVEVTVWGDGIVLRGEHASDDIRVSIDSVVEKLNRQVRKYRSRLIEKRRIDASRAKRRRVAAAEAALRAGPTVLPAEIVRVKRFAVKPMTPDEAVVQLELLGHDFFVFRNTHSGEVNVLYRRKAGDYGLIEPE